MNEKLRVLVAEDVEDDARLVVRHLRRNGFDLEYLRVQTEEEFRNALLTGDWDLVLSDYKMPTFSAPRALLALQRTGIDIPFIVVSGTIGEDIAVECLRSGAADFVSKDNLTRLAPAVTRELKEAAHRRARSRAEQGLRQSEENARNIVAASSDGIIVVDVHGIICLANPAAERMLNRPVGSLIGFPFGVPLVAETTTELEIPARGAEPRVADMQVREVVGEGEPKFLVMLHDASERRRTEQELRASCLSVATTLSRALASRDPYTAGHQQRVSALANLVGAHFGLEDSDLWELHLGCLLHDVGKVAIPEVILNKPGLLSVEELGLARTHAEEGYAVLGGAQLPEAVALMALHHHERLDGSGYPKGLKGDALSLLDHIVIVCNKAEAMSSFRPYRRGASVEDVIAELRRGRGVAYESSVVDSVVDILASGAHVLG